MFFLEKFKSLYIEVNLAIMSEYTHTQTNSHTSHRYALYALYRVPYATTIFSIKHTNMHTVLCILSNGVLFVCVCVIRIKDE